MNNSEHYLGLVATIILVLAFIVILIIVLRIIAPKGGDVLYWIKCGFQMLTGQELGWCK
ncbi:MAG: hypothetical protein QW751_01605 [Candidatus Aenigmatarchaeota archaeon]|nr:hypothetical protein [Candidatus Aenigmarchaeota archaeon]